MVSGSNGGQLTQGKMMELLEWTYDKTLNGVPGTKSVDQLAADYLNKYDKETAIDHLVNNQITKATMSGVITGFGGIITLPVTVPANVASVLFVQMRMIATIAKIRGYDLKSDQVQTFVYTALVGSSIADVAKKAGIEFGNKLGINLVKKIPGTILVKINQAVGFRFVTKFGTKGIINLGKAVPLVGAGVGGTVDNLTTRKIAKKARNTFLDEGLNGGDGIFISKSDLKTIN